MNNSLVCSDELSEYCYYLAETPYMKLDKCYNCMATDSLLWYNFDTETRLFGVCGLRFKRGIMKGVA